MLTVSRKQAQKLGLKARVRLSPLLEKSCLLLSANVSYENVERDLKGFVARMESEGRVGDSYS